MFELKYEQSKDGNFIKSYCPFTESCIEERKIFKYKKALTHGSSFHADDVFSSALLFILYPNIQIERRFDIPENYDGIIFDIGGGKFDHHQPVVDIRENGIKYAAFGLLWREFGIELVSKEMVDAFDSSFVQLLDESDNIGTSNILSSSIAALNKNWDDDTSLDDMRFICAVEIAIEILEPQISKLKARERALEIINAALEQSEGPILYLPKVCPWKEIVINTDKIFVVYPSDRGGYNAQVVPKSKENRLGKKDFPSNWAGLRDAELEEVSGIKDLTFCHSSLFLCSAKTKEAAYLACYQTLN